MNTDEHSSLGLRELVERFRICWKTWPEYTYVDEEKRQIGYAVELAGTPEPWIREPEPGNEDCERVHEALKKVAGWIIPHDRRDSEYEIEPYHQSIIRWSLHHNRPDVMLTIKILHRHHHELPVDECEEHCLREMEKRLVQIGACRLQWTERKDQPRPNIDYGCRKSRHRMISFELGFLPERGEQ